MMNEPERLYSAARCPSNRIHLPSHLSGQHFIHCSLISRSAPQSHGRLKSNRHLISLPRRLRARTPTRASLISPSKSQPLLRTQLNLPIQLRTRILPMDEIAETTTDTSLPTIQSAAGFAEVGDGRELAVDRARSVPSRVQGVASFLRGIFVLEAGVDVADKIYEESS